MRIVDVDGDLYRTRVESGWVVDGRVRFEARSKDRGDCYLVHCAEPDKLDAIGASEFGSTITLRVEEPAPHQPRINYAEAYAFDVNWPPEITDTTRES